MYREGVHPQHPVPPLGPSLCETLPEPGINGKQQLHILFLGGSMEVPTASAGLFFIWGSTKCAMVVPLYVTGRWLLCLTAVPDCCWTRTFLPDMLFSTCREFLAGSTFNHRSPQLQREMGGGGSAFNLLSSIWGQRESLWEAKNNNNNTIVAQLCPPHYSCVSFFLISARKTGAS